MIEVCNISKSFNGRTVLKDISVNFEPGIANLIIGQSGSGKTILMKAIVGLVIPDSGDILLSERNFYKMTKDQQKEVRKDIGMVFQGGALFDSMTVAENILFSLKMFSKQTKKEMMKRVAFCLDRVDLQNVEKLYPSELSGGMQKRVAIARAIANNPKYLFCDEPNSGLDPQTSVLIDQLVLEITKEYNIITVINTHDMNSVMQIGERINFIYKGELWWQGTNKTILETNNKELNDFLFAGALTKLLREKENKKMELVESK